MDMSACTHKIGAVLVVCSVSGVQSQTLTVDRQMKRYAVPRLAFINKCDRMGANPFKCIGAIRKELKLPAAAMQLPIGLEEHHTGVVDLVAMEAVYFEGEKGDSVVRKEIPADMQEEAAEKRLELIEQLAEVDDEIGECFIAEEDPTAEQIHDAVRRQTISRALGGSTKKPPHRKCEGCLCLCGLCLLNYTKLGDLTSQSKCLNMFFTV